MAADRVTGWVPDDYARKQQADLEARARGLADAARQVMDDPAAVAEAFAESYAARFAAADALEAAYRSGHADISVLREAARIRSAAKTELGILGVETGAMALGVGAIAKGLRAARLADRLDDAKPMSMAMAMTERAHATEDAVADLIEAPGQTGMFDAADVAERVTWRDERASMAPDASAYDDSAPGSRSNVDTRSGQATSIDRILPTGEIRPVRFDGLDGDILVDRKRAVVTTAKAKDQALRQSDALRQYGMVGRWDVPSQAQADRTIRMFYELGIDNITWRLFRNDKCRTGARRRTD